MVFYSMKHGLLHGKTRHITNRLFFNCKIIEFTLNNSLKYYKNKKTAGYVT